MEISELVAQTVDAGVPPMELVYRTVRNCRTSLPVAYRTEVAVNSMEMGRLMQSEFSCASDPQDVGLRVTDWAIRRLMDEREKFLAAGRRPAWLSVPAPVAYAELPDMYERVKALLGGEKDAHPIRLCLEFSEKLLLSPADVRTSILDLKLLGVQSMLVCDDADRCPFFRLVDIPVDSVLLTPRMTHLVNDRNKPGVLGALVQYLRRLDVNVIACDTETREDAWAMARMDCEGCLPAGEACITLEEAILQKEDEH